MNRLSFGLILGGFLILSPIASAESLGGTSGVGGGGDQYAGYFSGIAYRLGVSFGQICAEPPSELKKLCRSHAQFVRAVKRARVLPFDSVLGEDGKIREAGPHGNGDIELNVPLFRTRSRLSSSSEQVAGIVAHEYMILIGLDGKDQYDGSSQLIAALKANYVDLAALVGEPPVTEEENRLYCETEARFEAPAGIRCTQPKTQIEFVRVVDKNLGNAWRIGSRLTWQQSNSISEMDAQAAEDYCTSIGARLPTAEETEAALSAGINYFLKTHNPDSGNWTSTPVQIKMPSKSCGFLGMSTCARKPVSSFKIMFQGKVRDASWMPDEVEASFVNDRKELRFDGPLPIRNNRARCVW